MQLNVVIAFALLVWWPPGQEFIPFIRSTALTWTVIVGQLAALWLLGVWASASALRAFDADPDGPLRAQHAHHRNVFLLRIAVLLTFAVDLILTRWPGWVGAALPANRIPALDDLIIFAPFLAGSVIVLVALFPIDRTIRRWVAGTKTWHGISTHGVWDLRSYLSFNIRHQLLTVVVPMSIILIAYNLTRDYEDAIRQAMPVPFAPDILLGLAAALVFLTAPWMLKRIWITQPLPEGPLRTKLQSLCDRTGLKCADILAWQTGGMVVNAAVMGLLRPLRYVMLSDALLESMSEKQIEAVFGHEAGHVRHHHIQFFLLFAVASMLVVSGLMEVLVRFTSGPDAWFQLSLTAVQIIGFATILCLWATVFGFISRRFERQADLFGARTVAPERDEQCVIPCSVHPTSNPTGRTGSTLCATGAKTFCDSLDRVAVLNGIPQNERSWRHSSIASRIEFLHSLANDPNRLRRFEQTIHMVKNSLIVVCVAGSAIGAYYTWTQLNAAASGN